MSVRAVSVESTPIDFYVIDIEPNQLDPQPIACQTCLEDSTNTTNTQLNKWVVHRQKNRENGQELHFVHHVHLFCVEEFREKAKKEYVCVECRAPAKQFLTWTQNQEGREITAPFAFKHKIEEKKEEKKVDPSPLRRPSSPLPDLEEELEDQIRRLGEYRRPHQPPQHNQHHHNQFPPYGHNRPLGDRVIDVFVDGLWEGAILGAIASAIAAIVALILGESLIVAAACISIGPFAGAIVGGMLAALTLCIIECCCE